LQSGSSRVQAASAIERPLNESIELSSGEDDRIIYFDMYRDIFSKMYFEILSRRSGQQRAGYLRFAIRADGQALLDESKHRCFCRSRLIVGIFLPGEAA
jgi:hypothetical protein